MHQLLTPILLSCFFISPVFAKYVPYSAPEKQGFNRNSQINNKVASNNQKPKNDYNITINYELGMHCTGFDFSYCCILPPYNSIQSQVVKTDDGPYSFPQLLKADPKDPTVLLDGDKRMKLEYGHVDNTFSEGTKLAYWNILMMSIRMVNTVKM